MAGRPEKISDTQLLQVVSDLSQPVTSSNEVSDEFPVIQKTVEKRLDRLYSKGMIDRKRIGRSWAYWITPDGEDYLAGDLDANELEKD